jgi:hypothetical protein
MKTENIIHLQGDTLTILEGKALEQKYPEKIKISGNIESISNFLKQRWAEEKQGNNLQHVNPELAIVTVDADAMIILFQLDPENYFGTEILAKLEFSTELKKFCINETKTFNREELIKLLRFNAIYFDDRSKHSQLLLAYQKLNLSSNAVVKHESDTRGNKDVAFQKTIDSSNIPTEFILNIPIFKGQPAERFRVEICLDATDASVRFWFESVELAELIEQRKKELFDKQLAYCEDFVIIHK